MDVLVHRPAGRRGFELRIVGLLPFALTHRIEGQRHEAFERQIRSEPLWLCLAFLSVAGLEQHRRVAPRTVRTVKIGSHIEAGQTFIDDLLDNIALRFNPAGNPGVKRPVIIRQSSQSGDDLAADHLLAALGVGDATDRDLLVARVELCLRDLVHPAKKRVIGWLR